MQKLVILAGFFINEDIWVACNQFSSTPADFCEALMNIFSL